MKIIDVENLTIDQIPHDENENFDFKSSKIKADTDALKNNLDKAVSGFSNLDGGCFIVGIDEDTGSIDSGIF